MKDKAAGKQTAEQCEQELAAMGVVRVSRGTVPGGTKTKRKGNEP